MRLGQTSVVHFGSSALASAIGFLATIYFARELGAEVLGFYALVLAVASWLKLGGTMGVSTATTKRISEGEEREAYFTAGAILMAALFTVLIGFVLVFDEQLTAYIGLSVGEFIVLLMLVGLAQSLVSAVLMGNHLVHLAGLLSPIKVASRSVIQVGLVVAGYGLTGMLFGYVLGAAVAVVVGLSFVTIRFRKPALRHFRSLFEYAKFSWLGSVTSQTFKNVDILVLGVFVPAGLVGIYSVAWTISKFLDLFGSSVSATLFPEISKRAAEADDDGVSALITDSIAYAGLVMIPGFVGGALLGERILRIYGDEFRVGATVLTILLAALLVYSYQKQLGNSLNAIDRPDLAFRVNTTFIVANVVFNVALVYAFGWIGAAVATGLSAFVALCVAFVYLRRAVHFRVPYTMIAHQWIAALAMVPSVYGGLHLESSYGLVGHNILLTLVLVTVGAGVYFAVLYAISRTFRTTVNRNVGLELPG
ncbi:oligosaccharide flippase family protein [Natronobiforma cellulositropha]|uniref:oligosaccharide flippase family protein n=1 Tax=Natronobiforma cellulositropha TaxID=1679076 RepID=UPI0021D60DFE|nr:polysaccharide biosynthesis C-terminal domain-containing protein [Natronobiforma cellulositropha]